MEYKTKTGKVLEYVNKDSKKVPFMKDETVVATYTYDGAIWEEFNAAWERLYVCRQIDSMCCVFPLCLMTCLCCHGGPQRLWLYARGKRKYQPYRVPTQADGTPAVALMLTERGLVYPNSGRPGLTWDNVDLDSLRLLKSSKPGGAGCTCFLPYCGSGRVVPLKRLQRPESLRWQMVWGVFFPCLVTTCCHEHVPGYFEVKVQSKSQHYMTDADDMQWPCEDVSFTMRSLDTDPDELLDTIRAYAQAGVAKPVGAATTSSATAAPAPEPDQIDRR